MVHRRFEPDPDLGSQPEAADAGDTATGPPAFEPGDAPLSPLERVRRRRANRRRRVARRTVAILPTLLTLGNLLCGCAAIFIASRIAVDPGALPLGWTPLTFAAIFIFAGMAFDSLDGGVARLTRSSSEFGAQLDSMADMVTFGVAPAFVAIQLVGVGVPFISELEGGDAMFDRFAIVCAGIYVVCAGLRLARFNIELDNDDEVSHDTFKGLPTPGAAGTVASLILLHQHFLANWPDDHWSVQFAQVGMVAVMLAVALAMVSAIRYLHVVNRYMRGRAPISSLAHAVIVALLLVVYPQAALAGVFVIYALSAPLASLYRHAFRRAAASASPGGAQND